MICYNTVSIIRMPAISELFREVRNEQTQGSYFLVYRVGLPGNQSPLRKLSVPAIKFDPQNYQVAQESYIQARISMTDFPAIAYRYGDRGVTAVQVHPDAKNIVVVRRGFSYKDNEPFTYGLKDHRAFERQYVLDTGKSDVYKNYHKNNSPLEINCLWQGIPFSINIVFEPSPM